MPVTRIEYLLIDSVDVPDWPRAMECQGDTF